MGLPLLQLPEIPLLNVLKQMDVLDKIRLNTVFDAVMQYKMSTYISLGKIEIIIGESESTLKFGKFYWCFKRRRDWTKYERSKVLTHFPMHYQAFEDPLYDPHCWLSCVENTGFAVIRVYQWVKEAFPRTELAFFSIDSPRNSVIEQLMAINLNEFERGTVQVPFECNNESTELFKSNLRNRDVVLAYVSEEDKPVERAFFGKVNNQTVVPFLATTLSKCQYTLLSGTKHTEKHLSDILWFWLIGGMEKLLYVRASGIRNVDLANIVSKTRVERFNGDFTPVPQFAKYFGKGFVFSNAKKIQASIHIDDDEGTVTIVVWRAHTKNTIQLFDQLSLI